MSPWYSAHLKVMTFKVMTYAWPGFFFPPQTCLPASRLPCAEITCAWIDTLEVASDPKRSGFAGVRNPSHRPPGRGCGLQPENRARMVPAARGLTHYHNFTSTACDLDELVSARWECICTWKYMCTFAQWRWMWALAAARWFPSSGSDSMWRLGWAVTPVQCRAFFPPGGPQRA